MFGAAPQAKGRLLKDIQRSQDPALQKQGIWYVADDLDISKGYGLIKGPNHTPYEGCLLLFFFRFPTDYPFSPPKVEFRTSDGKTRFHPNLYVEGKVCLSILGTYSGPKMSEAAHLNWSGTQSLTSVLLSLLGLLDENPLAHEPSFEAGKLDNPRYKNYADTVEYNMAKLMVDTLIAFESNSENVYHPWHPFRDALKEELPAIKKTLVQKIQDRAAHDELILTNVIYNMELKTQWKELAALASSRGLNLNEFPQ